MSPYQPLPRSASNNKYILVVQDYFSKWGEAYALPHQKAKLIATTLVNEWIARHGVPRHMHTDQGSNFQSDLMKDLADLLDISKTRTTPYHPESDGMVERLNGSIERMLKCYVEHNQQDWDNKLPLVMSAYRSSVHATTKYTPHYLLYGHEYSLPVDLILPRKNPVHATYGQYARHLKSSFQKAYKVAKATTAGNMMLQKKYYDRKSYGNTYDDGSLVWLFTPHRDPGTSRKLYKPWSGPWQVVWRKGVVYKIENVDTKKVQTVHFNRMKQYNVRVPQVNDGVSLREGNDDEEIKGMECAKKAPRTRKSLAIPFGLFLTKGRFAPSQDELARQDADKEEVAPDDVGRDDDDVHDTSAPVEMFDSSPSIPVEISEPVSSQQHSESDRDESSAERIQLGDDSLSSVGEIDDHYLDTNWNDSRSSIPLDEWGLPIPTVSEEEDDDGTETANTSTETIPYGDVENTNYITRAPRQTRLPAKFDGFIMDKELETIIE